MGGGVAFAGVVSACKVAKDTSLFALNLLRPPTNSWAPIPKFIYQYDSAW